MVNNGFQNEDLILYSLNNKKFKYINQNLKNFLITMKKDYIDSNTLISCSKKAGINKTDLIIEFDNTEYNVSIKSGKGNSVHQEKVEEFIIFLKNNYNLSNDLANDIRFFIWGDKTLDGTGNISDRLSATELKELYPDVIKNIKDFFYIHKRDLIERFIIKGSKSNISPDYIYYGTSENGIGVKSSLILDWLSEDENESVRSPIPVGKLTFQAWNRNINGGNKSELKRGVIQLKWATIEKDLKTIANLNKL